MAEIRNVLLVVVDQWRGDTLSYLGHPCVKTPNLDMLCREGVTFRNNFTQGVPCAPARASLLTGQYVMNHRVVQNGVPMDARHVTLAHALREAGYDPALVGYTTTTPDPRTTTHNDPRFWNMGNQMDGWNVVGSLEPRRRPYFDWLRYRGVDVPDEPNDIWLPAEPCASGPGATRASSRIDAEQSDTSWATEHGLTYLHGAKSHPWFLHLGYYRPHPPFIAPNPYNKCYAPEDVPAPVRGASPEEEAAQHPLLAYQLASVEQKKFFRDGVGLGSEMDEGAVRRMRASYYGLIDEVDDHLGRLIAFLKDSGQYDSTLIVFTSDHGEQLGDHYLLGKLGYFDGSFHIPLVIRDPRPEANRTRGRIVDAFTETVDVMPTILDWLGQRIPRTCEGASLLPFVEGRMPDVWRREVHFEYDFRPNYDIAAAAPPLGLSLDQCGLAVIRDERYKYVHFDALPPLFFDLQEDPHEFRNLADDPAYTRRVLEYAQKMLSWRLHHADRTLTGYSSSPNGLLDRTSVAASRPMARTAASSA
jgi:arylsulfatase A-like enzyme